MELFRFRPPLPERSPRSRPNCWRKRGNSLSYASRSISQWKSCATRSNGPDMYPSRNEAVGIAAFAIVALAAAGTAACSRGDRAEAGDASAAVSVGVTRAIRMPLERQLTLSSELVPFQEIDVYAKESGYVRDLRVDYGTRVTAGQLMAVLEIPELQAQLEQDKAAIQNMTERVTHADWELNRVEAQHKVAHLQYSRLKTVSDSKPGLVTRSGKWTIGREKIWRRRPRWKHPDRGCSRRKASSPPSRPGWCTTRCWPITRASRLRSPAWSPSDMPIWACSCKLAPVPALKPCRW